MRDINETEIRMYSLICSNDGIKARDIATKVGVDKTDINRLLYNAPFIHELCYRDTDFNWHGLIRQAHPHLGLGDFCGYSEETEPTRRVFLSFRDRCRHQAETDHPVQPACR